MSRGSREPTAGWRIAPRFAERGFIALLPLLRPAPDWVCLGWALVGRDALATEQVFPCQRTHPLR